MNVTVGISEMKVSGEPTEAKGIAAFLRKPFLPEALKQTVDAILGEAHA